MRFCHLLPVLALVCFPHQSFAQTLYKYVDANGKVTYSDRKPEPGEKAELVKVDKDANVMAAHKPRARAGSDANPAREGRSTTNSAEKKSSTGASRSGAAADAAVLAAEKQLEVAKKALQEGQAPLPEEQQIVVRQGGNSVVRTPEYFARIAALEEAVNKASALLDRAREAAR